MTPEDFERKELLSYLRTPSLDENLSAMLESCLKSLCEVIEPRTIWRVLPVEHTEDGVKLGGFLLGGKDIAKHLTGCSEAVLMAATLSGKVDSMIRRAQLTDMTKALLYDAIAGAAIEHVCEDLTAALRAQLPYEYFTERFSAGYGDFPLTQQADLVKMMDATRKIGLTVTPRMTLLPMKSVTAVIGLSHSPVTDARRYTCGNSCALCPMRDDCAFSLPDQ
ncbi:MAG: hypothetical protein IK130_05065 [Oscillospiraceae bacterium]|nr:hypothetical protein [Oscillospiraceae bacterium]